MSGLALLTSPHYELADPTGRATRSNDFDLRRPIYRTASKIQAGTICIPILSNTKKQRLGPLIGIGDLRPAQPPEPI